MKLSIITSLCKLLFYDCEIAFKKTYTTLKQQANCEVNGL